MEGWRTVGFQGGWRGVPGYDASAHAAGGVAPGSTRYAGEGGDAVRPERGLGRPGIRPRVLTLLPSVKNTDKKYRLRSTTDYTDCIFLFKFKNIREVVM